MSFQKERCPKCGTSDIDYDELATEDDEQTVIFKWYCYRCPCIWNTEYVFKKRYLCKENDY